MEHIKKQISWKWTNLTPWYDKFFLINPYVAPPKTPFVRLTCTMLFSLHLCWLIGHPKSTVHLARELWRSTQNAIFNHVKAIFWPLCWEFFSFPTIHVGTEAKRKATFDVLFWFWAFWTTNSMEMNEFYRITRPILWNTLVLGPPKTP